MAAPPQVADIIYSAADTDVSPPIAISQTMPPWHPSAREATRDLRGFVRLLIDQSGAVVSATMFAPITPTYDQALLRAARDWKFQPARKQGVPVRFLKLLEIRLKPSG